MQIHARQKSLQTDVDSAYADLVAGRISQSRFDHVMNRAEAELGKLKDASAARGKALGFASCASPDEYDPSSERARGVKQKNLTPADMPQHELENMFHAAQRRQPYRCEINSKAFGPDALGVRSKAPGSPVFEGNPLSGGLLPPVNIPGLTMGLRYESTVVRISDHLPTITVDAPAIEYVAHVGDTNIPQVTVEGGVKIDIGEQWTTKTCSPIKLAALASASMEILNDFSEFAGYVQRDLVNAVADAENDQIVLGTGAPGMNGLVTTSGALSRSYNGSTDTSGIDTIVQSFTDIRVGSAKGKADMVLIHPRTWDFLRRTKTTTGAYV
ncbi:hypothetical protein A5787_22595 [Mycobacterium sp. 852002-50816_SCH5313054-b]|nr:hypothetical protein A5787_22595 [Mycobacterium sp. 852002-50816_SCH5313054-b]